MSELSILVVDDVQSVRSLVKKLLAPLKAEISEAEAAGSALDLARSLNFDLIISDNQMPGINGITLCLELKKDARTHAIPVIMLSDFFSTEDIKQGFNAGADAYVSKVSAREELLDTVNNILKKQEIQQNSRILIVDDERDILRVLNQALSRAGFQTSLAKNGLAAFKVIEKDKPDLILSDIEMPIMNGFEFCRAIKADAELSAIPLVMMSANSERAQMMRMMQQGAAGYVIKPFNPDELIILINKLLSDQYLLLLKDRELLVREQHHFIASITSLVSALEARDSYTRGHSDSVARIATCMLALTGADNDELTRFRVGARLHDIGKIGVRDNVLLKPGKLTAEELDHIKQHPAIGNRILQANTSLADIMPIVRHHHERWDGTGYPDGLQGEEIPFWARLTAVADTYDAMTSDRSYRPEIPKKRALEIVGRVSGTQLCPDCVDLFMDWFAAQPAEGTTETSSPGNKYRPRQKPAFPQAGPASSN